MNGLLRRALPYTHAFRLRCGVARHVGGVTSIGAPRARSESPATSARGRVRHYRGTDAVKPHAFRSSPISFRHSRREI